MKKQLVFLVLALVLASCGGGGGGGTATVPSGGLSPASPATPAPAAPATTAPVTSASLAPTSLPLQVSTSAPVASVDPSDAHAVALNVASAAAVPAGQIGKVHMLPVQPGAATSARTRRPRTFVNSPFDVSYYGGVVVGSTVSHNIYVSTNYANCGTSCWGNPGQFLTDLGASPFMAHLDQYIGLSGANRYTKGASFTTTFTLLSSNPSRRNPVIGQSDLMLMIYSAAQQTGGGYGHIFHVFLHPGLDTCFDLSSVCYSPDNPSTFAFCAYHGSVDYSFGRHYLYTIEPYQDVPGCALINGPNAAGNGDDPADSTYSTLSHELFETITDPDYGSGWLNGMTGDEIADPCRAFLYIQNLNGNSYALQSEYSDVDHACIN